MIDQASKYCTIETKTGRQISLMRKAKINYKEITYENVKEKSQRI